MRFLLIVLLAVTCEHERKLDADSTSTVTETERSASAGTETKLETRTREPSEIVTDEGIKKYAWVQPPEGSDAGVQWLPVEEKVKRRTAKIGAAKTQSQTDSGWNASGEGMKGAETALKVKATDTGSSALGPPRSAWVVIAVGVALLVVSGGLLWISRKVKARDT